MKKIIPVLILVACLLVVLCACGGSFADIKALNDKLSADYSGWDVKVITTKSGVSLTNEFNVTKRDTDYRVDYRLEKLNEISLDSTSDFKSVSSGIAIVDSDGNINEDLDSTDIAFENLTNIGLKFDSAYFTDAKTTSTTFSAKVKSTKEFCGIDNVSNMSVSATFEKSKFSNIVIFYTAQDGAGVSISYDFH